MLLVTGSVGSGHTRAAEAVRDAALRAGAASSAEVVDALAFAVAPFRACYRDAYVALIERAPAAVGWIYRSSDVAEGGAVRRAVQRAALAGLRRLVRTERPDTIVCTHFLPAEVISGMVARGEWRGRFGVVVTDLDAHAAWAFCPEADAWFAALPETVEILAGKGVARDRIAVTGIPISDAFAAPLPSREALRERHGLPAEGPLVLVSGGGVGLAGMSSALEQLLALPIDGAVAFVAGRNEELRRRAEALVAARASSRMRCRVYGFTDRMHELMRASDLSIGKPGGLTSSEALASGLPMVVMHPVPGQEERNSDHLLEWGVAIRANSPESFGWRIAGLLADRERLAAMRARALERARPFAADAVVDGLVAIATQHVSERREPTPAAGAGAGRAASATSRRERH